MSFFKELLKGILPSLNTPEMPKTTAPFNPNAMQLPSLETPPVVGASQVLTPDKVAEPSYRDILKDVLPSLQTPAVGASQALTPDPMMNSGQIPVESDWQMPTLAPAVNNAVQNPVAEVASKTLPSLSQSQMIQNQINETNGKDYSIKTDANGNVIRGKDRDRNSTWKDKLKNISLGALEGLATGGLPGAFGGAVAGGVDRDYASKFGDRRRLAQALPKLAQAQQAEQFALNQDTRKIGNQNILDDNAQRKAEFETRTVYNKSEQERKTADRVSREETARMRGVAGILKDLPSYDPADPRFAELTKALGDVKLPLTPKDAKKKVDLKQDNRTGAWEAVVTDTNGQVETRPVTKADGTQLKTTPQVVMAGEYGMLRQDDQQQFSAGEAEKSRQFQAAQAQKAQDLQVKLTEYRALQTQIQGETNFERRKALQERAAQLQQEGRSLTQQMRQEDMVFQSTLPKRK